MMRIARLTLALAFAGACIAGAQQAGRHAKAADNDPDLKEMRDYRLSMDKIQKYVAAFKALSNDPTAACLKDNPPGNAKTLAEGDKIIANCGHAAADIRSAGLKPHEFLVMSGALLGDIMTVQMKKEGTIKTYPDTISPENAAFLEQNFDKVQALLAPLTQQSQ
jgi:hypothetical protein